MSRPDLHMLTGAYALNAVPREEEGDFVAHLSTCGACAIEVAELEATAARLAGAVEAAPPPELRGRVLAAVATTRQERPRGRLAGLAPEAWPTWLRSPATMAAALLLVISIGLAGVSWTEHRQAQRSEQLARNIAAVIADPSHRTVTKQLPGGATGSLVTAGGHAVLLVNDMPTPPAGHTYQLWLMAPGNVRPAGLASPKTGTLQAYLDSLDGAAQVGVSVEPSGGSKQPTTTPILVFDLPV